MVRAIQVLLLGSAAAALLFLPACSPTINLPGKQIGQAAISNEHFIASDGALLPLRSWLPEKGSIKAVIVSLHGFNDYSNAFTTTGNYLRLQGIACYAYDQRGFGRSPGHGLWSGTEAYTDDLSGFVAAVRRRHPAIPLYILGESMGGAITIVAMTGSNPPKADGVILVAPAVWGRTTMPWYQRWLLDVSAHMVPWMTLTGKGVKVTPSDNREMLRELGRDPLVIRETRIEALYGLTNLMDEALARAEKLQSPTLVQYGKHDEIIPKEPMLKMLEKIPASTRKAIYPQGYHMLLRDLNGKLPLADIVAWITDRDKPLPYGSGRWD